MGEVLGSILRSERVEVEKDHDPIPEYQEQQRQQNHTGMCHLSVVTVIFLPYHKITTVIGDHMEKLKHLDNIGKNIKWCKYYQKKKKK